MPLCILHRRNTRAQRLQGEPGGVERVRTQSSIIACSFPWLMPYRTNQDLEEVVPAQHAWPQGWCPCSIPLPLSTIWSSSVAVARFLLCLRGSAKRWRRWRSAWSHLCHHSLHGLFKPQSYSSKSLRLFHLLLHWVLKMDLLGPFLLSATAHLLKSAFASDPWISLCSSWLGCCAPASVPQCPVHSHRYSLLACSSCHFMCNTKLAALTVLCAALRWRKWENLWR